MSLRHLKIAGTLHEIEARLESSRLHLRRAEGQPTLYGVESLADGSFLLREGDRVHHVHLVRVGGTTWVHEGGRTHALEEVLARGAGAAPEGSLVAPMTGTVQELLVELGELVVKGQALLVISAMKMQVEIKSPRDGKVTGLPHGVGDQVDGGSPVAVVEATA